MNIARLASHGADSRMNVERSESASRFAAVILPPKATDVSVGRIFLGISASVACILAVSGRVIGNDDQNRVVVLRNHTTVERNVCSNEMTVHVMI